MKEKHTLRIPSRAALDAGAAMAERYFKNGPTAVQMNEVGLQRLLVDAYEAGRCEATKTCHELTEQNKALVEALKELVKVSPSEDDLARLLKLCSLDDSSSLNLKISLFGYALEQARAALSKSGATKEKVNG